MPNTYGRTREEIQASAIGDAIVKTLTDLERFQGDPEMVLDNATAAARNLGQGVRDAVTALRRYYLETEVGHANHD